MVVNGNVDGNLIFNGTASVPASPFFIKIEATNPPQRNPYAVPNDRTGRTNSLYERSTSESFQRYILIYLI